MAEGRAEGRTETLPHQVCPPWGGARSSSRLGATARPRTVVVVGGGVPHHLSHSPVAKVTSRGAGKVQAWQSLG